MTSFKEANLARISLKIPFSHYSWVKGLAVEADGDGFCVVVYVTHIDNQIRKTIPSVHDGVSIKIEVDS